jgi:hypothetical protein
MNAAASGCIYFRAGVK